MKKYDNTMSLAKFLSIYKGLQGKDLKKLSHTDVKYLFPDLKRCSDEMLDKDRDSFYQGNIVLVDDGQSRYPVPYLTPDYVEHQEEIFELKEEVKYDYYSMSIGELKQVLDNKFSTHNQKHLAKRQLIERGAVLKRKYNRCMEKRKKFEEE